MKMKKRRVFKSWEMRRGGNQLAEFIEKDFSYTHIAKQGLRYGLNPFALERLKIWIDKGFSVRLAIRELRARTGTYVYNYAITDFFRGTGKLLHQLAREVDAAPVFDEQGVLIQKYSFLDYEEFWIDGTAYRVVETRINRALFWREWPSKGEIRKFEKTYIYRLFKHRWIQTQTKYAKDYLNAMKMMKKMK